MDRPLDGTLAPPWVFVRTSPFVNREFETETPAYPSLAAPVRGFTHCRSLRARPPFTRPCRSFFCAYAELIRGQMPPTDFCNCLSTCGQPNQCGPRFPRRDGDLDLLPFLTHHAAHRWAVARGEPHSVRFDDPGAGSSRLPEFAQPRYLRERPTTAELPRRCIVRIDEYGSKDRVKDASRFACNGVPCLRPVPTLISRGPTAFPSSATFGHPLSPARSPTAEEAAMNDNEPA